MPSEVGLLAKLRFKGAQAIAGMRQAGGAFGRLTAQAKAAQAGVRDVAAGLRPLTMAAAGMAAGAGVAVKKFSDFESQFGAVKAVLGKEAKASFPALEKKAMELGATTSFTAKQAAEAMENLARAGMAPKEIMSAIGPTLKAAAAEGMNLGTAADIVASNMRAFGLEANDARKIAGQLALVSAKTNTNMVSLQEGMKFVAPVARSLKIPLGDTATTLGMLANVGIKGSLAGTALKNALIKLSAQAKNGKVKIGQYSATIHQTEKGKVKLADTMMEVMKQLDKIKDPLKKNNAAMKLFGLRGAGVTAAFGSMKKEKIGELFKAVRKETGKTADDMAKMRLDNIHGDFVKLGSAVDGAAIAIGKALGPTIRPIAKDITAFVGDVAAAFKLLGVGPKKGVMGMIDYQAKLAGLNSTAVEFVQGFKEGLVEVKSVFKALAGVVKTVGGALGWATGGMKGFVSTGMKVAAIALSVKVLAKGVRSVALVGGGLAKIWKGAGGKGAAGGLGGAAGAMGTPVRVTNFAELRLRGTTPTGGPTPGSDKAKAGASGMQKAFAALIGFEVGWQVGKLIDKYTGASGWIAKKGFEADKHIYQTIEKKKLAAGTMTQSGQHLADIQKRYAAIAAKRATVKTAGGKEISVAEAFKREARTSLAGQGLSQAAVSALMTKMEIMAASIQQIPAAVEAGAERGGSKAKPQVNVTDVHRGVTGKSAEAGGRRGKTPPGGRGRVVRGGN